MNKLIRALYKKGRKDLAKKVKATTDDLSKYLTPEYGPKEVGVEEETDQKLKLILIKYFKKNPNPNDDDIHNLAENLKIDTHRLETVIYSLLGKFINLKHNDIPDAKFDPQQLKMGIKVEMEEHTDEPYIAKAICKAHLIEMPKDYYTKLAKMEKEAGVE